MQHAGGIASYSGVKQRVLALACRITSPATAVRVGMIQSAKRVLDAGIPL